MSSIAGRVIKNTAYLYIKTFISMFVMLYVTRIVLQSLGAEDFGIYDVVGGAISMLGFLNISMANTIQRFLNNAQGHNDLLLQRKVYNIAVVFHVTIAIIMVLILGALFFIFFNGVLNIPPTRIEAAKVVYICLMVSTFFSIVTVPYDASINAHEDLLTYSVIGIIDIFLKLGVAIAICHTSGDKLILYAILMMTVPIATYIMMKIWCTRHYEECVLSLRKYYDKSVAKRILSFSGWSLLGTSSNLIGNYGNSIVLNHFFGTILNSVMGIANQFQGMLLVLSSGMLRSLNPVIYKSGVTNSAQLMYYSCMGCKYSYVLLAIFAIPVMIKTPEVLRLWLGDIPVWAVFFVRMQLVRCLIEQLTTTLNKSLESVGKIMKFNIWISILNIIPIPLLYVTYALGMPPSGHYIVAIFFMVLCVSFVKIKYCMRYCGLQLSQYIRVVLFPCVICTIPSIIVGELINNFFITDSFASLVITTIVVMASILLLFYFTLQAEERTMLNSILKSFRKKIFNK